MSNRNSEIGIDDVLNAYRCGLFPMADSRDSADFFWYDPPRRGQLSIAKLHIPARLKKTARQHPYHITINQDFTAVIDGCAATADDRRETWINRGIRDLFIALHRAGYAHSIETRDKESGKLAGGLYGLAIGAAFMGESMFSRATDASKIALIALCAQLRQQGFTVLDTQYTNEHLEQFGVFEISREEYRARLNDALKKQCIFSPPMQSTIEIEIIKQYINSV